MAGEIDVVDPDPVQLADRSADPFEQRAPLGDGGLDKDVDEAPRTIDRFGHDPATIEQPHVLDRAREHRCHRAAGSARRLGHDQLGDRTFGPQQVEVTHEVAAPSRHEGTCRQNTALAARQHDAASAATPRGGRGRPSRSEPESSRVISSNASRGAMTRRRP